MTTKTRRQFSAIQGNEEIDRGFVVAFFDGLSCEGRCLSVPPDGPYPRVDGGRVDGPAVAAKVRAWPGGWAVLVRTWGDWEEFAAGEGYGAAAGAECAQTLLEAAGWL